MKIMSFYNEKGGVGKSTFTIMYASWLKYKHGVNVGVVDFNNRQTGYRQDEIRSKKELAAQGRFDMSSLDMQRLWPIYNADKKDIAGIRRNQISRIPSAYWLERQIRSGAIRQHDVLLIDLPGAAMGQEFIDLLLGRMVGLWCIVIDRDPQTSRASVNIVNTLEKAARGVKYAGFINQAQSYVTMREYEEMARIFMDCGLPMLPDVISFSERMKKISEPDIMRSTLEYPDWSLDAFRGSRDLGTENLFIDITRLLHTAEELKDTREADLSFVDTLEKTFQERRQLTGTSFPEYEFDGSLFPKSRQAQKQ